MPSSTKVSTLDKMKKAIGKVKGAGISREWKMSDEEMNSLSDIKETVYLGRYAYDRFENECALLWDVVERNDTTIQLVTHNIIDRINPKYLFGEHKMFEELWPDSAVREWLHRDLINYIFSPAERALLIPFTHDASEVEKDLITFPYFIDNKVKEEFKATPYAVFHGASVNKDGSTPRMSALQGELCFGIRTFDCFLDGDPYSVCDKEDQYVEETIGYKKWGLRSGIKLMVCIDISKVNEALKIDEETSAELVNTIELIRNNGPENPSAEESLITYGPEEFMVDGNPVERITRARRECPKELMGVQVIYIPYGVEYIDDFAFRNCTNLEKIYIPDTVKRIGKEAFMGCTKLKNIVLNSVDVETWAFRGSGIENVYVIGRDGFGLRDNPFRDCEDYSIYGNRFVKAGLGKLEIKHYKPLRKKEAIIEEMFDYYWKGQRRTLTVKKRNKEELKLGTVFDKSWCDYTGFHGKLQATVISDPVYRGRSWVAEVEIRPIDDDGIQESTSEEVATISNTDETVVQTPATSKPEKEPKQKTKKKTSEEKIETADAPIQKPEAKEIVQQENSVSDGNKKSNARETITDTKTVKEAVSIKENLVEVKPVEEAKPVEDVIAKELEEIEQKRLAEEKARKAEERKRKAAEKRKREAEKKKKEEEEKRRLEEIEAQKKEAEEKEQREKRRVEIEKELEELGTKKDVLKSKVESLNQQISNPPVIYKSRGVMIVSVITIALLMIFIVGRAKEVIMVYTMFGGVLGVIIAALVCPYKVDLDKLIEYRDAVENEFDEVALKMYALKREMWQL